MEIILNGEKETLNGKKTVLELIKQQGFNPDVVTISLNGDMLHKDDFAKVELQDGDSVDILLFMGGGR